MTTTHQVGVLQCSQQVTLLPSPEIPWPRCPGNGQQWSPCAPTPPHTHRASVPRRNETLLQYRNARKKSPHTVFPHSYITDFTLHCGTLWDIVCQDLRDLGLKNCCPFFFPQITLRPCDITPLSCWVFSNHSGGCEVCPWETTFMSISSFQIP